MKLVEQLFKNRMKDEKITALKKRMAVRQSVETRWACVNKFRKLQLVLSWQSMLTCCWPRMLRLRGMRKRRRCRAKWAMQRFQKLSPKNVPPKLFRPETFRQKFSAQTFSLGKFSPINFPSRHVSPEMFPPKLSARIFRQTFSTHKILRGGFSVITGFHCS